jgi:hypothetical protein
MYFAQGSTGYSSGQHLAAPFYYGKVNRASITTDTLSKEPEAFLCVLHKTRKRLLNRVKPYNIDGASTEEGLP